MQLTQKIIYLFKWIQEQECKRSNLHLLGFCRDQFSLCSMGGEHDCQFFTYNYLRDKYVMCFMCLHPKDKFIDMIINLLFFKVLKFNFFFLIWVMHMGK